MNTDEMIRIPPAEKRKIRAEAKAAGKCINCLERDATIGPRGGLNYCDFCREKFKSVKARGFDRHREELVEQMAVRYEALKTKHLCVDCKAPVPVKGGVFATRCDSCRNLRNARKPTYSCAKKKENRIKVIEMYGNKCQDCGYDDLRALEFHHIKIDADLEHPRMSARTTAMIGRIIKNGFDPSIALLCSNCHRIRHIELGIEHTIIPTK